MERGANGSDDADRLHTIQPDSIEFYSVDGVFIKTMHIKQAGVLVPQHAHEYDHLSMLAHGSVRVWCNEVWIGDYHAPKGIEIKAGKKHKFLSLTDDTLILCIHNIARSGIVEILARHEIGA